MRTAYGKAFVMLQPKSPRPPDIKSAGQTVSYGEKMGLKYLYVKIYDVLGDLKKYANILSYCN